MLGKCGWERLFEAPNFFSRYKHFIMLMASSASDQDQLQWCGLVESKIRHLISEEILLWFSFLVLKHCVQFFLYSLNNYTVYKQMLYKLPSVLLLYILGFCVRGGTQTVFRPHDLLSGETQRRALSSYQILLTLINFIK